MLMFVRTSTNVITVMFSVTVPTTCTNYATMELKKGRKVNRLQSIFWQDVECSGYERFAIWDIQDMGCLRSRMFEIWNV